MSGQVERVALVTGATGGIGTAIVKRLAADGFRVWISDVSLAACEALADEVRRAGAAAVPIVLDVCSEQAWRAVVEAVQESSGGLHALVNNAGIGNTETVVSESLDAYERVIGVTQTGVFLGMKHAGSLIERSGGGAVVNISSILGTVAGFGVGISYAAAKGAVRTMTKNAAVYWARKGVRVNSLHPGFISTSHLLQEWGGSVDEMTRKTPMRRLGSPEEVAGVVSFLVGPDASYVTGSEIYADGGWTAV